MRKGIAMRHLSALGLALLVVAAPAAPAHSQAPPTCEDQLRATRILAERYQRSRQRAEVEASAMIADLAKEVERLRAALEAAKAAPGPKQ